MLFRSALIAFIAASLLSIASVGNAATPLEIPQAGVALTIPKGWTAATEGSRYLVASPKGRVVVVLLVVEARDADAALAEVRRNQLREMTGVRAEKRSHYRQNSLDILEEQGTGAAPDRAGATVWRLAKVTGTRPVIVYTLSSPTDLRLHQREYEQLQRSFRPL